jgi:dipeptidyl aminopeptidase/acylaminoacyl peptidase
MATLYAVAGATPHEHNKEADLTMSPITLSRRTVLQGLGASALLPWAARAEIVLPEPPPLIAADYAVARQSFRTRLTVVGPSPDPTEPLDPPPGAERIAYRSDGLELAAWVSVPRSGGPAPGLIYLHGGNVLGSGHWELTEAYREAGYAVIMPALRGENGLAGAFSGFYDENADVLAAAEHLAGLPGVDRSRMFVAGHSIGGTQTMLAAMSTRMFRGATTFSGGTNAWRFFSRFPEMLCFDAGSPREFEMRSPVCYATSFKCPVRILYGSEERRLAAPSEMTAIRAHDAGLNVEAAEVPGDHFSALAEETKISLAFFASL